MLLFHVHLEICLCWMPEMIRVSGVDLIASDNLFDFHLAFTSPCMCWHFSVNLCITKKITSSSFSLSPSLYHPVSLMLCTNERFSWHWSEPSQIDYEFRTLEWVIDYRPVSAQHTCKNMRLGAQQCWKVTKYIYASISLLGTLYFHCITLIILQIIIIHYLLL